jgi:hypothetical protein
MIRLKKALHLTVISMMVLYFSVGSLGATLVPEASAASPQSGYLSYQGRLKDTNGDPVSDGSHDITFVFYDALTAGNTEWAGETDTVTTADGYFSTTLGDDTSFSSDLFNEDLWVGITYDSETFTPRVRIHSAPYAITSQAAEALASAPSTYAGRMYYNTSSGNLFVYDAIGVAWVDVTAGGGSTTLDDAYDNFGASAQVITVDDATTGISFDVTAAGNFDIDLQSTGDFVIQDGGAAWATFTDAQAVDIDGTGAISFDADAASNFTTSVGALTLEGAGGVTVTSTSGTLALNATGQTLDVDATAIDINGTEFDVSATTGSVTIDDAGDAGAFTVEGTVLDIDDLTFVGAGLVDVTGAAALTLGSVDVTQINLVTDNASATDVNITGSVASSGGYTASGNVDMVIDADAASPIDIGADVFASGNIIDIAYDTAETLSGDVYGLMLDLQTNVTTSNGNGVYGGAILLPAMTQTSADSTTMYGMIIDPGAIEQNTGAGDIEYVGMNVGMPDLTETTGSLTSTGFSSSNGSAGVGGTQSMYYAEATGVAAGTLRALEVSDLDTPSGGTEVGLYIGENWDATMVLADTSANIMIADTGVFTFEDTSGNDFMTLTDAGTTGDLVLTGDLAVNGGTITGPESESINMIINNSIILQASSDVDDAIVFDLDTASGSTITTKSSGVGENLRLTAVGTGDVNFDIDANTVVNFAATAAPGVDMVSITNTGQAVAADGIDGMFIDHYLSGSNGSAGLHINLENDNTDAAESVYGLYINMDDASAGADDISHGIYVNMEEASQHTSGTMMTLNNADGGHNVGIGMVLSGFMLNDILLHNGDYINNSAADTFAFDNNNDGNPVNILGDDGTGATQTVYDTTGAGTISLGSADVTQIDLITDNNSATDVNVTGSLTVSNDITTDDGYISIVDTSNETALVIGADNASQTADIFYINTAEDDAGSFNFLKFESQGGDAEFTVNQTGDIATDGMITLANGEMIDNSANSEIRFTQAGGGNNHSMRFNLDSHSGGATIETNSNLVLWPDNGYVIPGAAGVGILGHSSYEWDGLFVGDDGTGVTYGADQDAKITWQAANAALELDGGLVVIGTDPTGATATGDGDLLVQDALEVDGAVDLDSTLDVAGAVTLTGALTSAGNVDIVIDGDGATPIDIGADVFATGNIIDVTYDSMETQTAAVTGINLDLNTKLTGVTAADLTGISLAMNAWSDATASDDTETYTGFDLATAGAMTINDAGSTINWRGANITLPVITQTAGTVQADGVRVLFPANAPVVTGGTMNGINVVAPTGSGPSGAATINGINIGEYTLAGGAATEIALNIGAGWDTDIKFANGSINDDGTDLTMAADGDIYLTATGSDVHVGNGVDMIFSNAVDQNIKIASSDDSSLTLTAQYAVLIDANDLSPVNDYRTLGSTGLRWGGMYVNDDNTGIQIGSGQDTQLRYETADANANALHMVLPDGDAANVPVFALGDASMTGDLGFFDGVTDNTFAIVSDDAGDYVTLDIDDGGVATMTTNTGDITLAPAGGNVNLNTNIGIIFSDDDNERIYSDDNSMFITAEYAVLINAADLSPTSTSRTLGSTALPWGGLIITDDQTGLQMGHHQDVQIRYESADANASALHMVLPDGDGTNVPVFAIGDASMTGDLGFFDGVTDNTFAIVSDDAGDYVSLTVADNGKATLATNVGDIILNAADNNVSPIAAGTSILGDTTAEWDGIYIGEDGVGVTFGAGQEFVNVNDTGQMGLRWGTDAAAANSTEEAIYTFAYDTGADTGATANQEIFEIGHDGTDDTDAGWVELFAVDDEGDTSVAGQLSVGDGLVTEVVAAACDDTKFAADTDGLLCIDSSNGRIYYRYGGAWHYSAQDAGIQIPNFELEDFETGVPFEIGDYLMPVIESELSDGALHARYTIFNRNELDNDITLLQNAVADLQNAGGADVGEDVEVLEHVYASHDAAGRAYIVPGDTFVMVEFEEEYEYQPIVTVTQRSQYNIPGWYWVEEESTTGFKIMLDGTLGVPVEFNWMAMGVEEGVVSVSDGSTREIEIYILDGAPEEEEVPAEEEAPVEEPAEEPEEEVPAEEPVEEPVEEPAEEEAPVEEPAEEEAPAEEPEEEVPAEEPAEEPAPEPEPEEEVPEEEPVE